MSGPSFACTVEGHPHSESHRVDREGPAASSQLPRSSRICEARSDLDSPSLLQLTLPVSASAKNDRNLASTPKMSVTTSSSLLTSGIAIVSGHARAATAAGNALSVPYFTADGPGAKRTPDLHPAVWAPPRVSNFASGNRRCTHGSVSGRSTKVSSVAIDDSATESFYLRSRASVGKGSGHKCAPARFRG